MKSGIIGRIDAGQDQISDFTNTIPVEHETISELNQCLNVTADARMPDGRTAQYGRAAIEEVDTRKESRIKDGRVETYEEPQKVVKATDFLFVPGSFVAAGSGSGRFIFELISNHTENDVNRLEFDIDDYVEEAYQEGINPWKIGFYDNVGYADNGVVHGEQLLSDPEFEEVFQSSYKNQVGFDYTYEGKEIKNFVTESGYVEVYQPSDFSSGEFADYVETELLQHGYRP